MYVSREVSREAWPGLAPFLFFLFPLSVLCVYPTLGGCANLVRLLGRGLLQLFKRPSS
jgi:hypothetical protein